MASMPTVVTTPLRKTKHEQADKGAVSKIPNLINTGAEPSFNYRPRIGNTRYMKSPCGIQPIRSAKKPRRKPLADAGIFPIRPAFKDVNILGDPTANPRKFLITQLKPPSKTLEGQIRKAPVHSQQYLPPGHSWKALQQKASKSINTTVADNTITNPTNSGKVYKRRSISYTGNNQSKIKSRIPMPVKSRRVDPYEIARLEEEEEELTNRLTRVRGRLQHLKALIVFRRPPLIAQRQHQSAIRTNSGATHAAAYINSPNGMKTTKRRRSSSVGSFSQIKFKTRIPVLVKTGRALADPKEIEKLEKEERELEKQLNRVQETLQNLKAPIIIRKPMMLDGDKRMNQLEGASLIPEVKYSASASFLSSKLYHTVPSEPSAPDDDFKLNNPPPVTPHDSGDDAFLSDNSWSGSPALRYFPRVKLSDEACTVDNDDIPVAPFSPDLFLDASKTKSPTSIYKHLRKRTGTLLVTPPKPVQSSPSQSTFFKSRNRSLLHTAQINSTSKRVKFQLANLFGSDKNE